MSGGAICHLNIEQRIENVEPMFDLLESSSRKGVVYMAVNYSLQQCEEGHMGVGKGEHCTICGAPVVSEYSRVVGFLTATKNWHKVRREQDWPNRVFYQGLEN